jgi:uncharacterized protein YggE
MKYDERSKSFLDVTGYGAVEVPPDLAEVRLAVITEAATAAEATSRNAARLRQVLDAVEALPHERVSTVGLSLHPIYTYDPAAGSSSITGYRAENSIAVESAVDDAGSIFDAGIAAGANTSSGIGFRLRDERPRREEALALAYQQAHADATTLADVAGMQLLGPEELTIEPEGRSDRPMLELARFADASTPVLPGLLSVTASVRVRFGMERHP